MIQAIHRNSNILNNAQDLKHLFTFEKFPVFMGCTEENSDEDLYFDMSWHISESTGIIQLNPLIPEETLYSKNHGAGSVGKIWKNHHVKFAEFFSKLKPNSVLEIGGGHGLLSLAYKKIEDIPWTIVDPNSTRVDGVTAKTINCFFDENFSVEEEYDLVVHSHVFEHMFYPNIFLQNLSSFIKSGKRMAFSVPNMKVALNRNYANCISFEHTIFLTEPIIESILSQNKFIIEDKEYYMKDHSIFYVVKKVDYEIDNKLPSSIIEENELLFFRYINHFRSLVEKVNIVIKQTTKPVFIFGAHVFTQYLIAFGLETTKVKFVLDNDPNKHNKRLYGTDLHVKSPKILENYDSPLVVAHVGAFTEEIKQDVLKNINPNCEFI